MGPPLTAGTGSIAITPAGRASATEPRVATRTAHPPTFSKIFQAAKEWPGTYSADWKETHGESLKEIGLLDRRIASSKKALDRYLKAFETARLPESACASRVREIEKELSVLEAEKTTLEAGAEPPEFSEDFLLNLKSEIADAVENGSPQRVKRLLSTVVDSIEVESRMFVQPYFNVVAVRTPFLSRPRRERRTNRLYAGRACWFKAKTWGRVG